MFTLVPPPRNLLERTVSKKSKEKNDQQSSKKASVVPTTQTTTTTTTTRTVMLRPTGTSVGNNAVPTVRSSLSTAQATGAGIGTALCFLFAVLLGLCLFQNGCKRFRRLRRIKSASPILEPNPFVISEFDNTALSPLSVIPARTFAKMQRNSINIPAPIPINNRESKWRSRKVDQTPPSPSSMTSLLPGRSSTYSMSITLGESEEDYGKNSAYSNRYKLQKLPRKAQRTLLSPESASSHLSESSTAYSLSTIAFGDGSDQVHGRRPVTGSQIGIGPLLNPEQAPLSPPNALLLSPISTAHSMSTIAFGLSSDESPAPQPALSLGPPPAKMRYLPSITEAMISSERDRFLMQKQLRTHAMPAFPQRIA